MLPAPFAERCDGGMVVLPLLFAAPPSTHTHSPLAPWFAFV